MDMSEDFLNTLRELQDGARPHSDRMTFSEWYRETELRKTAYGPGYNSGVGMMGSLGTSSSAVRNAIPQRSGQIGTGLKQFPPQFGVPSGTPLGQSPSKYTDDPRPQPLPWIDDVDMSSIWYSPMQPVWPFGPPYITQPREWNFPVGYNLNYIPKRIGMYGMLRSMRQSWGVLATVEATRMDQLLRIPWTIQRKDKPRGTSVAVDHMRKFFRRPDGKLSYSQWTRKLLFDVFDIDAPSMYVNRLGGVGRVQNIQVIDGSTIFPLIDDSGRRPDTDVEIDASGVTYLRRQPAFQQIIYGLPMNNYSEDEILYPIMRPRPELPMFGYSPVEQCFIEIMEAIRKTLYQLEFWRAGSMPELIVTVPDNWTPRQIASFQGHFDALLSGNLTLKSKVRFVPGGMKPFDIKNASGESLWSHRDEMLIRLCCYAFSVSPTPFIQQNNRACYSADTETLTENGWKFLDEIGRDEKIATVNPDTGELEYHIPTKFFMYEVEDEELVHFKTKTVDVLVTPEHDMWMRTNNRATEYKKIKANDHPNSQFFFQASVNYKGGNRQDDFILPSTCRWIETKREDETGSKIIEMDVWVQFLGYFISEGGLSADKSLFTLSQHKDKTYFGRSIHTKMNEVLRLLGINSSRYEEDNQVRWTVANKQLCDWLRDNVGVYSDEKRIPRFCFGLCRDQLRLLFDCLMAGDGSWDSRENRNSGFYSTTSMGLADDVQELAFLLGYSVSKSIHYEAFGNRNKCYRVAMTVRPEFSLMGAPQKETPCSVMREQYSGTVYCFEVPNHLFVTRRNGKVGIHGNTAQNASQTAQEEGLYPLMSWMKDDVMDRIIELFGYDDIEFVYLPRPEVDLYKQAQIHQIQLNEGIRTRNEVREELGQEPFADGDIPTITTGAGVIPLHMAVEGQQFSAGGGQEGFKPDPGKPEAGGSNKPENRPMRGQPRPHSEPSGKPSAVHKLAYSALRAAAKETAKPTKGQRHAGNYKKGHVNIQGLSVSIETPKGKKRKGHDDDGTPWKSRMASDYGYIRGTIGADGDQIDTCIGRHPKSPFVFVIDQFDSTTGKFDEHKVMLGYRKPKAAMSDYFDSNGDGLGPDRLGAMVALSMNEFKNWLANGDHTHAISRQGVGTLVARHDNLLTKFDTISVSTNLASYGQQGVGAPQRKKKKKKRKNLLSGPRWMELGV